MSFNLDDALTMRNDLREGIWPRAVDLAGVIDEVERLRKLCSDLVGLESLYQDDQYETEMRKIRAEVERLRTLTAKQADIMREIEEAKGLLKETEKPDG